MWSRLHMKRVDIPLLMVSTIFNSIPNTNSDSICLVVYCRIQCAFLRNDVVVGFGLYVPPLI